MNNYNINENNFLITSFVMGEKGIPYGTTMLLMADPSEHVLNIVYNLNMRNHMDLKEVKQEDSVTLKIPFLSIKNISYVTRTKLSEKIKKVQDFSEESSFLSMALYATSPVMNIISFNFFNHLFEELSNNYDKVNVSSEYEIYIDFELNGEEKNYIFSTIIHPDNFISLIQGES